MLTGMTSEPEQQIGVGTPDAFQRLWTPHRMAYIQGENKPSGPESGDGCPFCVIPSKSDEDGLVVARGEKVYAVLNLYPYNGGHLMVVPYRHVADYTELDGRRRRSSPISRSGPWSHCGRPPGRTASTSG